MDLVARQRRGGHRAVLLGGILVGVLLTSGCTSSSVRPLPRSLSLCSSLVGQKVTIGFRCVADHTGTKWSARCFPDESIRVPETWHIPIGNEKIVFGTPHGGKWALADASIAVPNMARTS